MKSIVELLNELKTIDELALAERFRLSSLDVARHRKLDFDNWLRRCVEPGGGSRTWRKLGISMKKASAKKSPPRGDEKPAGSTLRLGDLDTRIRGMNIAAAAAREYLRRSGKARVWPAHLARLVDANTSLMGQRIMVRVRKFERAGEVLEAERAFQEGMKKVGVSAAKEFLSQGN